jgi:hypothetical protein
MERKAEWMPGKGSANGTANRVHRGPLCFRHGMWEVSAGPEPSRALMGRVADQERELAWLLEQPELDVCTGLDPAGWPASVWVLHAMYEDPRLHDLGTYEDLKLRRHTAGAEPAMIGDVNMDEMTTDAGIPLGCASDPGPGWSRLTWADYLAREGHSLNGPHRTPPGYRWFPSGSWHLHPAAAGRIDGSCQFRSSYRRDRLLRSDRQGHGVLRFHGWLADGNGSPRPLSPLERPLGHTSDAPGTE